MTIRLALSLAIVLAISGAVATQGPAASLRLVVLIYLEGGVFILFTAPLPGAHDWPHTGLLLVSAASRARLDSIIGLDWYHGMPGRCWRLRSKY